MPTKEIRGRTFDARPDRIDYRDRIYNPPLVSLPEQYPDPEFIGTYLADYTKVHGLVLDQGREGACTGFGLAAVINYLQWRKHLETVLKNDRKGGKVLRVSPRMLYHMARIYDEWPGEDYEGSSCRGAMKGWHRHGVCAEKFWPYKAKFVKPKEGWQQDAARRPLGAYYRIDKDSVADMQAAIREVGAIYVSSSVHAGWFLDSSATIPEIPMVDGETGGHAYAMIGYTPRGFIVQNSWGAVWGYHGFAILTYEDWIQHGTDAWVSVLGAPMEVAAQIRTRSSMTLQEVANGKASWSWRPDSVRAPFTYARSAAEPLDENAAYERTVVLGNDGRPINRFLDVADAAGAVREAAFTLPLDWLRNQTTPKLAIYAHGGLNNEETSLKRIRVMAPYFSANGIYPLFVTWRTGFGESISGMLEDAVAKFAGPAEPSRGLWSDISSALQEAKDRTVEAACEHLLVKPVWMQMKQNAAAAAERDAGLFLLAGCLADLKKELPNLEIHLVGHSAGSILHGHLLDRFAPKKLAVETVSLFAPACTVGFALDHYVPAAQRGIIGKERLFFDILSDEREQADTVGPYGKSLLYLVSRALEEVHKMPILGMEGAWDPAVTAQDIWIGSKRRDVEQWQAFMGGMGTVRIHTKERAKVFDGHEYIPLAHGSFDNDTDVVAKTIERIRGAKLAVPVENLHGF
ncbi:C1 family peptidase [Geobacter sp.]|uniref:C1 family peptidase n=1 Tax=Geobacter sp. TaxID=46610 RepID=UPI002624435C|nr:C1 family peptidase [Geobacter sp.]